MPKLCCEENTNNENLGNNGDNSLQRMKLDQSRKILKIHIEQQSTKKELQWPQYVSNRNLLIES